MAETKTRGSDRTRNWAAICYPESAVPDWQQRLSDMGIEAIVSPLHDKDVDPTGEAKKPHHHILLCFGGVKSYEQVSTLTAGLGWTIPQRCHNLRAATRYMMHLDNPDKHQYPQSELVTYGGIDIAELLRASSSERYTLIEQMCDWVLTHSIVEMQDLMDYARVERRDDWWPLLCDNSAYVVGQYIKSQRHRLTPPERKLAPSGRK